MELTLNRLISGGLMLFLGATWGFAEGRVQVSLSLSDLVARAEGAAERTARPGLATVDATALWQAADAAADVGEVLVRQGHSGQDQARVWARRGMAWAEAASKAAPDRVEAWFAFARCVGVYSDCVDLLTLFAEGVQGRIQTSLQSSYRLDRWYRGGGPVIALARYWQSLPGFAGQDLAQAEALYNEYLARYSKSPEADPQAWLWRSQLYWSTGRKDLARSDLVEAQRRGGRGADRQAKDWGL